MTEFQYLANLIKTNTDDVIVRNHDSYIYFIEIHPTQFQTSKNQIILVPLSTRVLPFKIILHFQAQYPYAYGILNMKLDSIIESKSVIFTKQSTSQKYEKLFAYMLAFLSVSASTVYTYVSYMNYLLKLIKVTVPKVSVLLNQFQTVGSVINPSVTNFLI